jgi:hypothetical protein
MAQSLLDAFPKPARHAGMNIDLLPPTPLLPALWSAHAAIVNGQTPHSHVKKL